MIEKTRFLSTVILCSEFKLEMDLNYLIDTAFKGRQIIIKDRIIGCRLFRSSVKCQFKQVQIVFMR